MPPEEPEEEEEVEQEPEEGDEEAEPEDEGDEGDEGDDEAHDEEEEPEEAKPKARMLTVTVDGRQQRVPEREVIDGYLRTVDYTRKTQALAQERRGFEQEKQSVQRERAQYAELLPKLTEQLQTFTQPNIDWDRLFQESPAEYVRQQALKREAEDRLQAIAAEQYRLNMIRANEEKQEHIQTLERERAAMLQAMPEWKDPAAWEKARAMVRHYALLQGWSEDQVKKVTDHRAVIALWKAAQLDHMAKQPKALPQPKRVQRAAAPTPPAPGPHPVRRKTSQMTRDKQRLAKTHSIRDAAAVIEHLL
jgi:hypothetical protein